MLPTLASPVFCNAAGELAANPAGYAVLQLAPGLLGTTALAELLAHTGELLRHQGWRGMLCNAQAVEGFDDEALAWLLCHWLTPGAAGSAHLFKALVIPASSAGCAAFGRLRQLAPLHTHYAYFAHETAAHAYLTTLTTLAGLAGNPAAAGRVAT